MGVAHGTHGIHGRIFTGGNGENGGWFFIRAIRVIRGERVRKVGRKEAQDAQKLSRLTTERRTTEGFEQEETERTEGRRLTVDGGRRDWPQKGTEGAEVGCQRTVASPFPLLAPVQRLDPFSSMDGRTTEGFEQEGTERTEADFLSALSA